MWIARNKLGDLRLFEFPPKRFHSGNELSPENIGFNDAITVEDGKDNYSFWAIQQHFDNTLEPGAYGISIYRQEINADGKQVFCPYVPNGFENLKWEDEPIEISLDFIHLCRCHSCKKMFVYYDEDIIDESEPEKENFYMYVECPHCSRRNNI